MQLQFILFGLTLISSTVLALYPAANYDSIVKSSVLIHHKPENHYRVHNHHEQSHVINRNGAFLITNFKKPEEEKPHRALVIRKPVLITSLSNRPAEIVETNKHHEIVNVKQISHPPCDEDKIKKVVITQKQPVIIYKKPEKPVTTTVKPEVHEEKHDEPLKFTINIEQPKPVVTKEVYEVRRPSVVVPYGYGLHSNQVHGQFFQQPSYYYAPQIQPVIPQQYGYGYTIYGRPSIPKPIQKPHVEYISKPNYEYGVPKQNSAVSFTQKEVPHYVSYPNTVRQFGYSFTAPIQPTPPKVFNVPNYAYSAPKPQQNSTVSFVQKEIPQYAPQSNLLPLPVRQFGYSFSAPSQPAPPKVVNVPHYAHSAPKPQENVAFVQKEIPHYASQPNIAALPVQQFGYSFTAPIQPTPPKIVNVPNYVQSAPKPHVYQPNIIPTPVRQFGYSYVAADTPVPKPSIEYGVPSKNVENNEVQQPQRFGFSYTIHNQPSIGISHPGSKPSTENHVSKLIQPVPKPSTEYGLPKLIQPVPKPSTEYGVPKVSNFGPIVVAPFDPLASGPFATNQHLPIVDKHVQFSSS